MTVTRYIIPILVEVDDEHAQGDELETVTARAHDAFAPGVHADAFGLAGATVTVGEPIEFGFIEYYIDLLRREQARYRSSVDDHASHHRIIQRDAALTQIMKRDALIAQLQVKLTETEETTS